MSDNSQENPESNPNPTPQEQLEMRILAMLLGETDEAETTEVTELLQQDPQLQAYTEKMQKSLGLVEESAKSLWSEETTAPQQLSEDRRKVLEELWSGEQTSSANIEKFPTAPTTYSTPKSTRKVQIHPFIPVAAAASLAILIGGVWFPKMLKQEEDSQVAMSAEMPETVVMDESNSMPEEKGEYDDFESSTGNAIKTADFAHDAKEKQKEALRYGDQDGDGLSVSAGASTIALKQKRLGEVPSDSADPVVSLDLSGGNLANKPPAKTDPTGTNGSQLKRPEEIAKPGGFDGRDINRGTLAKNESGLTSLGLNTTTLKDLDEVREMKAKISGSGKFADKFHEDLKSEEEAKPATFTQTAFTPRKQPSSRPTGNPAPEPEPAQELDPFEVVAEKANDPKLFLLQERKVGMSKTSEPAPDIAPAPVESTPVPAPVNPRDGTVLNQVVVTNSTKKMHRVAPPRPTAPPAIAATTPAPQPVITLPTQHPVGASLSSTQPARSNTRPTSGSSAPQPKLTPRRPSMNLPAGIAPPPTVSPPKLPNYLDVGVPHPAEPAAPSAASAPRQPVAPASNEGRLDSERRTISTPDTNFRYRQLGDEATEAGAAPFGGGMKADELKKQSTDGVALTENLSISGFIDYTYKKDAVDTKGFDLSSADVDFTFSGENAAASKDRSEKKSVDKLSALSRGLNEQLMDLEAREGKEALANKEVLTRNDTLKGAEQSAPKVSIHYGTTDAPTSDSPLNKSESTITFDQSKSSQTKTTTGLDFGKSLEREKLTSGRSEVGEKANEKVDQGEVSALSSKLEKSIAPLAKPQESPVEELKEADVTSKEREFANDITDDLGIELEVVLPEPKPEVLTASSPFSTFSLNVTDASFRLCEASLLNGQLPPPHIVRAEEFINAFDYRDPAPVGKKALSFAWDRSRHPFAHNRDLVRFSIQTAAEGRQGGQPLNLVLTIDNSGSMERADRVAILQQALQVLSTQLKPQDKVSVIAFARTPRLWINGLNGEAAAKKLAEYDAIVPQGGTNIESALNLAYETAQKHFIQHGNNRVILLTDGAANLGEVVPKSLRSTVEVHRKKAIALDCFGIGWDGYNDHLMEALARNGDGRYAFLNSPKDVERDFARKLAGALTLAAADVKVQVEFNPKRVKTHRQIGYLRHQLKKEDFRNNAVDAAEIGSAESGNAMYVLQIDPKGSGIIGKVRVRYREPASGQYKETSWDLPYKSNVQALDQSAPAMRLSATAATFAEWLGRSPFAGDVDLAKLREYITGLQTEFPSHSPVQNLLQMIRAAELSK